MALLTRRPPVPKKRTFHLLTTLSHRKLSHRKLDNSEFLRYQFAKGISGFQSAFDRSAVYHIASPKAGAEGGDCMSWVSPKLIPLTGEDARPEVTCCTGDTGFACMAGKA
jgi:hypothetical protein